MINTTAQEEIARAEFAQIAAEKFEIGGASNAFLSTDGSNLLAIRNAGGNVIVVKLDSSAPIVNYQKLVKDEPKKAEKKDIPVGATHKLRNGDQFYKIEYGFVYYYNTDLTSGRVWIPCKNPTNVCGWLEELRPINPTHQFSKGE